MKILAATIGLLFSHVLLAQEHVQVIGDTNLDSLVAYHAEVNKEANSIQGYRVQIFFGTDRKEANDARTKFLQMFPQTEAYLIYQAPYFKVRVGDYRNNLEAQPVYRSVLTEFDKVFIVPDKINLPKLQTTE